MRKFRAALAAAVVSSIVLVAPVGASNATGDNEPPNCENPTIVEVTYVEHPAVTETTPAIWANWSPNNTQGPQDYVPVWPEDDRGTWHVHEQGIPGGHEGPDGVYQQGGGNSSWFYRQAEKVVVVEEAWTEEVKTEVPNPDYPCEEPPVVCPPGTSPWRDGCHLDFNRDSERRATSTVDCESDVVRRVVEYRVGASRGTAPLEWGPWEVYKTTERPATDEECPPTDKSKEPNKPEKPHAPDKPEPVTPDRPKRSSTPAVPTVVDAGL